MHNVIDDLVSILKIVMKNTIKREKYMRVQISKLVLNKMKKIRKYKIALFLQIKKKTRRIQQVINSIKEE